MNEQNQSIDVGNVTPEQFAELVKSASDEEIVQTFEAVGTDEVLDRVFDAMEKQFVAAKAEGVEADVVFNITHAGSDHPYTVTVSDGKCETRRGSADNPKTTITTDLVSFARLTAGSADGVQLFMQGKLRVSGDLMFSQRLMSFFDRPNA